MESIKRKLGSLWTFWAALNVVSVPILFLFGFFLFSFFFHICMTTILQLGVYSLFQGMCDNEAVITNIVRGSLDQSMTRSSWEKSDRRENSGRGYWWHSRGWQRLCAADRILWHQSSSKRMRATYVTIRPTDVPGVALRDALAYYRKDSLDWGASTIVSSAVLYNLWKKN